MNRTSERGNAIFILFIAVALFGMLAYAFMHGSRGNVSMMTAEKAKAYATESIGYGNDVQMAVKRLQARGCTATQVSFENADYDSHGWTQYDNPNAPADESCHVFSVKGGGLKFQTDKKMMTAGAIDKGWPAVYITGYDGIPGVGTDCAAASCNELIFSEWGLKKEICVAINDKLGITNPGGNPPDDDFFASQEFDGAYDYVSGSIATVDPSLAGKRSACIKPAECNGFIPGGCYAYYKVLIER